MKTSAIVRLIIWTLVALLLTGLMVGIIVVKNVDFDGFSPLNFAIGFAGDAYSDASSYTVGAGDIAEEITAVDIYWTSGSITVQAYDGDTVQMEETNVNNEEDQLRYRVSNGRLSIRYRKSGWRFGFIKTPVKDLTLRIPRAMADKLSDLQIESASSAISISELQLSQSLDIEDVSGKIHITDVTAKKCDIDNVSGEMILNQVKADELDVETVSGGLTATGEFGTLDSDSVSGDVSVNSSTPLRRVEAESVSGDVLLTIPENDGCTASMDSVSGKFSSDFSLRSDDDKHIYKDGSARFNVDTVSGDFTIHKK